MKNYCGILYSRTMTTQTIILGQLRVYGYATLNSHAKNLHFTYYSFILLYFIYEIVVMLKQAMVE